MSLLPFLQKSLIQFNNTSELLGQAKNMRIINYLAHCQKLGKFTVMSQPTILKLKVSKTGHASITFRFVFLMLTEIRKASQLQLIVENT